MLSWNRENRACRENLPCQKYHKSIKRKTVKWKKYLQYAAERTNFLTI